MSTTYPKWQNFLGGTLDSDHTSGTTTLTSAALAAMVAVAADDYMKVVLDPDGIGGAPEIVYVSAHTASATTATIVRGQEGTTARAHLQDVPWVHAVTASDMGGAWTSYTPTLTQSGAVTKTVTRAKYIQYGKTVHVSVVLTVTGTGTANNVIYVTLPLTSAQTGLTVGSGRIYDDSSVVVYRGVAVLDTTTAIRLEGGNTTLANGLGGTGQPFAAALAVNDIVEFTATYESI